MLICITVAFVFVSFWALFNRPEMEPPWPDKIQGFSFSPMRSWNDPTTHNLPTEGEIDEDLQLLAGKANAVRTYSVEGVLAKIPEIARKYDINVTLGIWLDDDLETNEQQIETAVELVQKNYRNVVRVIVGNEVLLRRDLSPSQLSAYLDRVRMAIDIPVGTAETWDSWLKHAELASHVDFIGVHLLPYWEGIHVNRAVGHVIDKYDLISKSFPDKPIVIAEVGWPSNGRIRQDALASPSNEAVFLRRFIRHAEESGYIYYIMEAFDQPWKSGSSEGAVGAYWGVYNASRQAKFPFTKAIVEIPQWQYLAAISIFIAICLFMLLVVDSRTLKVRGRGFLASVAFLASTGGVLIVYSYSRQYLTFSTIAMGLLLILGLVGVVVVLLAEAHEWAEGMWAVQDRYVATSGVDRPGPLPFVSIHVPTYNEPPAMLMQTLDGLARLDYPCYEVIVMDNNTKDSRVWQPVADHCARLGARFRFFHEDRLEGFKSGALNYALERTRAEAEIIAVIDSDYVVESNWLRDLVAYFSRRETAIVQAPQDYRDDKRSLFKAMCYAEYRGFFNIGMIIRNERNAIIQHGTMTMVRREVLDSLGGWAEWCITEDAELGLRIFKNGHEAQYVPKCYGRGLIPDDFHAFKKQRFRWAYGAVQIMRHNWQPLFGRSHSQLTYGQRYHFIAGWLPWLADSMNLFFTLSALFWSLAMIVFPKSVDPPMLSLSLVPIVFFIFKLAKMFYLYQYRVKVSNVKTLASVIAGLALMHTVAKAIVYGVVSRGMPFFRTPKQAAGKHFWYSLQSAREEFLMAAALLLAAWGVSTIHGSAGPHLPVWILVLVVQSVPYIAAVFMAVVAACAQLPARLIRSIAGEEKLDGGTADGTSLGAAVSSRKPPAVKTDGP